MLGLTGDNEVVGSGNLEADYTEQTIVSMENRYARERLGSRIRDTGRPKDGGRKSH